MMITIHRKVLIYAIILLLICTGISAVISFAVSKRIITDSIISSKKNELVALDVRINDSLSVGKEKLDLLASDPELSAMANKIVFQDSTVYEQSVAMNDTQNYMKAKLYSMKEFQSVLLIADPWAIGVGTQEKYQFVKNVPFADINQLFTKVIPPQWISHLNVLVPDKDFNAQHMTVTRMDENFLLIGIYDYSGLYGDKRLNLIVYDHERQSIHNQAHSISKLPELMQQMDKSEWDDNIVEISERSYVHIRYATPNSNRNYSLLLDEREIQNKFKKPLIIIVCIGFAVFLLFTIVLYLLSKRLLLPISRFSNVMSNIESYDSTTNLDLFIREHNNHASMRRKLFLLYMLCIIPLFVVIWTNYYFFRDVVIEESKTKDYGVLEEVHSSIEYKMRNYTMIVQYFALDYQVQRELISLAKYEDLAQGSDNMSDLLLNKGVLGQNIQYLKFYDTNYSPIYSSKNLVDDETALTKWKKVLDNKLTQYYWDIAGTNSSNMLLYGKIKYLPHQDSLARAFKEIGYVEMSVKPFLIEKIDVSQSALDKALLIVDKDSQILFASRRNDDDQERIQSLLKQSGLSESRKRTVELSDSDYTAIVRAIANSDWYIVQLVRTQSTKDENKRILIYNLYVVAVFLLLALAMSNLIAKQIVKPMYSLNRFMNSLDAYKLDHLEASQRGNEFAALARSFKDMLFRLQTMGDKIKEKELEGLELEKRKKEAQLTALQTQMNPHFLFNIFTSIHLLIKMNQNQRASEMIQATGKLLRFGLYRGNQFISVQEELDHVGAYIEIQTIRYKDRIKVEWHIEADVRTLRMPKFIIQPLVENVFEHAFILSRPLILVIRIFESDSSNLIIKIEDNGAGISEDKLKEIQDRLLNNTPSEHFGLVNVNERILLLYGHNFHLHIESEKNLGTYVTVKLPLVKET
jgi:sensor histidine kinase YesM